MMSDSDPNILSEVTHDMPSNEAPGLSVSRRNFLRVAGAFIAVSSIGVTAAACNTDAAPPDQTTDVGDVTDNIYPDVPINPMLAPVASRLQTFSVHEAQTVEALTARILPGTPDDPGAREAGVVTYIDNMLAFSEGYDQPTYRQPPFAETYDGNTPPVSGSLPGQYQVVYVKKSEIARYGYQSVLTPREMYRIGLVALDSYAQSKFQQNFKDLSEDQQDQIVGDLSGGSAKGFTNPSASDFFKMVRVDTINGMFSDPGYGGNKDMVGWTLIGYPGAQRAYTVQDIRTEAIGSLIRPPQSLAQMAISHPGQAANQSVILPQSGSGSSDAATMQSPKNPPPQH